MPDKVSIIIPAYNEEKMLKGRNRKAQFTDPLKEWVKRDPKNRSVILVNDGSTDATAREAKKLGFTVLNSSKRGINLGKGTAFLRGVEHALEAKFQFIMAFDADMLELTPQKIEDFTREIKESKFDMLLGDQRELHDGLRLRNHPDTTGIRGFKSRAFRTLKTNREFWYKATQRFGLETGLNRMMTTLSGKNKFERSRIEFPTGKPLRASSALNQKLDMGSAGAEVIAEKKRLLESLRDKLHRRIQTLRRK